MIEWRIATPWMLCDIIREIVGKQLGSSLGHWNKYAKGRALFGTI